MSVASAVTVATPTNVPRRNLKRWYDKRDALKKGFASLGQRGFNIGKRKPCLHPVEEDALYVVFREQREAGFPADGMWLRDNMGFLVGDGQGPMSRGWLEGFQERYAVREYARTVNKETPVSERAEAIRDFHRFMQEDLFEGNGIQPEQIYYTDEIPAQFAGSKHNERGLSMKGEPVFMSKSFAAADKREGSFLVTTCAGEDQDVFLGMVAKGSPSNFSLDVMEELQQYADLMADGDLKVYRQPNAWSSTDVMMQWLEDFNDATWHVHLKYGIRFLGTDQHAPRMTTAFRQRCEELCIVLVYGPAHCTDVVAPVDADVGVQIKRVVGVQSAAHRQANWARWQLTGDDDGHFTAADRRVLLTTWGLNAWRTLKRDYAHLIRRSFVKTGYFPLNPDGSQDHLIVVKGIDNYTFR